jgi:acetamidase/formamidase
MQRIARKDANVVEFSRFLKPALKVMCGESFVIETEDALCGRIRDENDLPVPEVFGSLFATEPPSTNPVGGPVFVDGVEKGDVLVVEIIDVVPGEHGVTCIFPGVGPLQDSKTWEDLRGPATRIIKHLPGPSGTLSDGRGRFSPKVTWDLHPFIGTIGVAPEREVQATLTTQGPWGGNLDVRDICKGSKLLLPAFNEGGMLFAGDVHGSQADTEFYGVADETRGELTLGCDVIKRKRIPFPRIETPKSIIQLACYRPMEEAVKQAILWLMEWLVEDFGFDRKEAYMHMGVNPEVRVNIYQMVALDRLQYTVGVEFPKEFLS